MTLQQKNALAQLLKNQNLIRVFQVLIAVAIGGKLLSYLEKLIVLKKGNQKFKAIGNSTKELLEKEQEEESLSKSESESEIGSDTDSDRESIDLIFTDNTSQLTHRIFQELEGEAVLNGKIAALLSAYSLSDVLFSYSNRGEQVIAKEWNGRGVKNALGSSVKVIEVETKSGALGVLHGSLSGGALSSAYISNSSSLLEMIPNLTKIINQRLPAVLHVEASSIFSSEKNSNVLSNKLSRIVGQDEVLIASSPSNSGTLILLSSSDANEAHHIGLVSHLLALKASTPVLHMLDGVRTSQQFSKVNLIPQSEIKTLATQIPQIKRHRDRNLAPLSTSSPIDIPSLLQETLESINLIAQKNYQLFEYVGNSNAKHILVMINSGSLVAEEAVENLNVYGGKSVGLLKVRLVRPWSAQHFLNVLPLSTEKITVLDQGFSNSSSPSFGYLFPDVAASIYSGFWKGKAIPHIVYGKTGSACKEIIPDMIYSIFQNLELDNPLTGFTLLEENEETDLQLPTSFTPLEPTQFNQTIQTVFWDLPKQGPTISHDLAHIIGEELEYPIQLISKNDSYSTLHGATTDQFRFSFSNGSILENHDIFSADFIICKDPSLLSNFNLLGVSKVSSSFILNAPWSVDELEGKLPSTVKRDLYAKKMKFYLVNVNEYLMESGIHQSFSQQYSDLALEAIFLQLSGIPSGVEILKKKTALVYRDLKDPNTAELAVNFIEKVLSSLKTVSIPIDWETATHDESSLPSFVSSSIFPTLFTEQLQSSQKSQGWYKSAWSIMFPEAYQTSKRLRPDIKSQTFSVQVSVNKRLTPDDYDRNVFHLEFETKGTGLKYEIGDALGVHGDNDPILVEEFLQSYDLNPKTIISFQRGQGLFEERTIEQLFIQQVDIFGRPSKKFYKSLSQFAKDETEKTHLEYLASSEGASEFKERVSKTITFADVLEEFKSARPPVETLVELIGPIKPRHYSIASSMKMHPNSVHLLVVLVDWEVTTTDGEKRKRYGQCTRFLSQLQVGQFITVSVKPSVMKLPEEHKTPIIMAGLGTGMAPFRAFIEERAFIKAQQKLEGKEEEIGKVVLYFGSRHRSQEYLYGEELEAYERDGILTRLGLAFSRDQKEKIYIQNKISEDGELVNEILMKEKGHFYLCGPTWPAADVRDAIVNSFVTHSEISQKEAASTINEMKDHERYILEVY